MTKHWFGWIVSYYNHEWRNKLWLCMMSKGTREVNVLAGQMIRLGKRKHRVFQTASLFGSIAGSEKLSEGIWNSCIPGWIPVCHSNETLRQGGFYNRLSAARLLGTTTRSAGWVFEIWEQQDVSWGYFKKWTDVEFIVYVLRILCAVSVLGFRSEVIFLACRCCLIAFRCYVCSRVTARNHVCDFALLLFEGLNTGELIM